MILDMRVNNTVFHPYVFISSLLQDNLLREFYSDGII